MRPLFVVMLACAAIGAGCGGDGDVDVVLTEVGDRPVAVIAEVRKANGIGLEEAKLQLDGVPSVIVEGRAARRGGAPRAPLRAGRRERGAGVAGRAE